jgi:hypothetical protein
MRAFRAVGLTTLGALAGFVAAAVIVKRAVPTFGDDQSDEVALAAIFDGMKLESRATSFRGGSLLAWFGGVDFDLRKAMLAPGAHLSVHALFGGVAIRVPPNWHIESKMHVLIGGVDVPSSTPAATTVTTLTLDGLALFGGIAVRARVADE